MFVIVMEFFVQLVENYRECNLTQKSDQKSNGENLTKKVCTTHSQILQPWEKKKLKLKHELNGRTNDTTILKKDVFYSAHINTHFMCFLSAPVKINRKHRVQVI